MNAHDTHFGHEIEDFRLQVPEPALIQLSLRLERDRAAGKVWDASLSYGVPLDALAELVDYWCDDFDFRAAEARLNELPLFVGTFQGQELCFTHVRSQEPAALPYWMRHACAAWPSAGFESSNGRSTSAAATCPRSCSPSSCCHRCRASSSASVE